MLRSGTLVFVGAVGLVAIGLSAVSACLAVPPPDLPQLPLRAPAIIQESVTPTTGQILTALPPDGFVVPLQFYESGEPYEWAVFVDYDPVAPNTPPDQFGGDGLESPADGGIALVTFAIAPPDPSQCHLIQFLVAHHFNDLSRHTWDSVGGDIATWFYNPGNSPAGCPVYDAGALQDGAFPVDASNDGLLVVPESGGDP